MDSGAKRFLLLALLPLFLTGCSLLSVDISGEVWFDVNADGIWQSEEPPLEGVAVLLLDIDGHTLAEAITDSSGEYLFNYQVYPQEDADPPYFVPEDEAVGLKFVLPGGYTFSPQDAGPDDVDSDPDPANGRTNTLIPECAGFMLFGCAEGEISAQYMDAGMHMPFEASQEFSIGDLVWEDVNGDGIQGLTEQGVGNVGVGLYDADGAWLASTSTDPSGYFQFAGLEPGDYSLEFSLPAGYSFTLHDQGADDGQDSDSDPSTGFTAVFSLGSQDSLNLDAGLVAEQVVVDPPEPPSALGPDPEDFPAGYNPLTGTPFCEPDAENWGVVGISISQFPPAQTRPPIGLSWAAWVSEWWIGDGDTRLYALFYGCYPQLTQFAAGEGAQAPEIGEGQYLVSDFVWYDVNGNSMQDAGEPGLPNVQVTLLQGNEEVASTVTDAGGKYYFLIKPQFGVNYRLKFELPAELVGSYAFVEVNIGGEDIDSDANPSTGLTGQFSLPGDKNAVSYLDAGVRQSIRIEGVRSGRIVFQSLARFFGACSIVSGVDPQVGQQINICATANFSDPENIGAAGVDISRLRGIAQQSGDDEQAPNLTGNLFSSDIPTGGQGAQTLDVFYNFNNQTQWQFDPDTGTYIRYQNHPSTPEEFGISNERLTGEALGFENVIVMYVPHSQLNEAGTIFDVNMSFATGKAKVFRDGQVFEIQWSTVSGPYEQESGLLRPIRFEYLDGTPFPLKPGKLWLHILHSAGEFWELEPQHWKARWYAPVYDPDA